MEIAVTTATKKRKRVQSSFPSTTLMLFHFLFDPVTRFMTKKRKRFAGNPMDLLEALPSELVEEHIYPYAVRLIQDHHQLIQAVDEYWNNRSDEIHRRFPIGQWDVERVSDFSNVFSARRKGKLVHFNDDILSWNVVNGTTFQAMFYGCRSFNSDVSHWKVANATNLCEMFFCCSSFNSDVSGWNVANATDLNSMFWDCGLFNKDVSGWNVASATDLSGMFFDCRSFNSDVSRWNVANATNLRGMFHACSLFDSDVSGWNVANATDLNGMFGDCFSFNSDISQWDLSNVRNWESVFVGVESFDREFVLVVSVEGQLSVRQRN